MAVVLADLLDEKQIVLELRARPQTEALREVVALLQANGKISDLENFSMPSSSENGLPQLSPSTVLHFPMRIAPRNTGFQPGSWRRHSACKIAD